MAQTCYGIDFGTSNTALAFNTPSSIDLAVLEGTRKTIPSAMFFLKPNNQSLYGRGAIAQFLDNEEGRFMRSLKRVLGTSLMQQGTVVNGNTTSFSDIIKGFLSHLKAQADTQTNQNVTHVTMGRPVFFVDGDDAANIRAEDELRTIAQSIGFQHVAFQFEPIAAAFAHEATITQEHLCLVVDIGGGTSDFTIVRLSPDRHQKIDRSDDILSNSGIRIGGNDFDKNLNLNCFMPLLGYQTIYGHKKLSTPALPFHNLSEWSKVNFVYTPNTLRMMNEIYRQSKSPSKIKRFIDVLENEAGHTILDAVENTKITLTHQNDHIASLGFIEDGLQATVTVNDLNAAIKNNIDKIKTHADECVRAAGVTNDDITMVILTGGSTELPLLQSVIRAQYPHAVIKDDDKFGSVARGLAHDALKRFA